ncbi:hypothetical protein FH972_026579 [Carpinus fangiana]|uniref:Uncharacterized protein n=1 Tax=Carpinus fangiana TaxID=176857 RepID=A0A5N6L4V2_9ROSI|nr:hypothetical protein FH972_026579 [Carpinus fangiana]
MSEDAEKRKDRGGGGTDSGDKYDCNAEQYAIDADNDVLAVQVRQLRTRKETRARSHSKGKELCNSSQDHQCAHNQIHDATVAYQLATAEAQEFR